METKSKKEIKLYDIEVEAYQNSNDTEVICIRWSGNIGFGEYTIYRPKNKVGWIGDSECMDTNNNKEFLKLLLDKFIESITVEQ